MMKHLKLFENYLSDEDLSIGDKLKESEDFLDDVYTELFDEWGFTYGRLEDIIVNVEKKVHYFIKEIGRADCNLVIVFGKNTYNKQIEDITSDANHIFMKKVKPKYKFSMIDTSTIYRFGLIPDSLCQIVIKVNVDDRNTGSY